MSSTILVFGLSGLTLRGDFRGIRGRGLRVAGLVEFACCGMSSDGFSSISRTLLLTSTSIVGGNGLFFPSTDGDNSDKEIDAEERDSKDDCVRKEDPLSAVVSAVERLATDDAPEV